MATSQNCRERLYTMSLEYTDPSLFLNGFFSQTKQKSQDCIAWVNISVCAQSMGECFHVYANSLALCVSVFALGWKSEEIYTDRYHNNKENIYFNGWHGPFVYTQHLR